MARYYCVLVSIYIACVYCVGFTSAECDPTCTNGVCESDVCWCNADYGGANCAEECTCEANKVCGGLDNCVACDAACVAPFGECASQGTTEPYDAPTCKCNTGYTGDNCKCTVGTCTGGECTDGTCWCHPNQGGEYCNKVCDPECSSVEICTEEDACQACDAACVAPFEVCASQGTTEPYDAPTCKCNTGYTGDNCMTCSGDEGCNNQGTCTSGVCECNDNFGGVYCENECTVDTCTGGECTDGVCWCDPNQGGEDCTEECITDCEADMVCGGTNKCVACDAACVAPFGECKSQGTTAPYDAPTCKCNTGYTGDNCMTCSGNEGCNNEGTCDSGVCDCDANFGGVYCENECNPNACTDGQCTDGICWCDPNHGGENCKKECTTPCDPGKICTEKDTCEACDAACMQPFGTCASQGTTTPYEAACECEDGYMGENCKKCSSDVGCNNKGTCQSTGVCQCNSDASGEYCQYSCDPAACTNGDCDGGVCWCDHDNGGANCAQTCTPGCITGEACTGSVCKACDAACMQPFGTCASQGTTTPYDEVVCKCEDGYMGENCNQCSSAVGCNHNGTCASGMCECNESYVGMYCELACAGGCADLKMCVKFNETSATCDCLDGLSGDDCMTVTCDGDKPCQNGGTCADGTCQCLPRHTGVVCEKECDDECTEDQQCEETDGSLVCKDNGATGLVGSSHVVCLVALVVMTLYQE